MSESEVSNEVEVPTAVTSKGACGGKPEKGLKRRDDQTWWVNKEYDSSETSDEDEEEILPVWP